MKLLTILLATFTISLNLFAQKGKIEGKVTDGRTGQPIAGVSVVINNTKTGISTNIDGYFVINADAGKQSITLTSASYQEKKVDEIEVITGQVTHIDIILQIKVKTGDEVVVRSSSAKKETVTALITYQRNTPVVAQVISAEAIRRSPDKSTGEVLKRVTGTSVQEGKYLVVRGLSDRYNQAMLNGILLSSTEPDRKTFSFDIFPAPMIDNIIMNKTFIPELPGEWAGGLVQVQTKDVPAASFLNIQLGTGFNSNTIGKDFYQAPGSSTDFIGVDNGKRALPNDLPLRNTFSALSQQEKLEYGKEFRNNWLAKPGNAPLNASLQLNGGGNIKLFGKKVAGIFALTS
jgi:hypothetical protein